MGGKRFIAGRFGLLKTLTHTIHPSTWAIAVNYDDSGSLLPLTFCCPFTGAKAWKEVASFACLLYS
jgi:hypothetical protein